MTEPQPTSSQKPGINWKSVVVGLLVYSALFAGQIVLATQWWNDGKGAAGGTFGDAFGGFTAFFTGLGFIGLAITIYLQFKQLKIQHADLETTLGALTVSLEEKKHAEDELKRRLHIETLSSRISALSLLIKHEENHIREAHNNPAVEWADIGAMDGWLCDVRRKIESGNCDGNDHCLARNLGDLIGYWKELKSILAELRAA